MGVECVDAEGAVGSLGVARGDRESGTTFVIVLERRHLDGAMRLLREACGESLCGVAVPVLASVGIG